VDTLAKGVNTLTYWMDALQIGADFCDVLSRINRPAQGSIGGGDKSYGKGGSFAGR